MNQSEILIIGSNGQLGKALQAKYPDARAVDSDGLDITDKQAVDAFDWSGTKIVINAAAYTSVDGAETPEGRLSAWRVNAEAVGNLTHPVWRNNIRLVHISTDYVFDGTQEEHNESEDLSPPRVHHSLSRAGGGSLGEHCRGRDFCEAGHGHSASVERRRRRSTLSPWGRDLSRSGSSGIARFDFRQICRFLGRDAAFPAFLPSHPGDHDVGQGQVSEGL